MEADPTDDILGPKRRNYEFLQLVRDKNYPDALLLGKLSTFLLNSVLKDQPNNPSVQKFVEFIEKNAKKCTLIPIQWTIWSNKKKSTSLFTLMTAQIRSR